MTRNSLTVIATALCVTLSSGDGFASCKKGVAISSKDPQAGAHVGSLNVGWYYNWGTDPAVGAPDVEYVPMVWGAGQKYDSKIESLAQDGPDPVVLAFNEPDRQHLNTMTVEEVIEYWDELESVANHLSSPAPARFGGPWFESFMDEAEEQSLKVDFLAVHWYGPANPKRLLRWVDMVHEKYGKPIWITEMGLTHRKAKDRDEPYTSEDVIRFMRRALPGLDERPYVQRYAWFGGNSPYLDFTASRLFEDDGELTEVGVFYAAHQDATLTDCSLP